MVGALNRTIAEQREKDAMNAPAAKAALTALSLWDDCIELANAEASVVVTRAKAKQNSRRPEETPLASPDPVPTGIPDLEEIDDNDEDEDEDGRFPPPPMIHVHISDEYLQDFIKGYKDDPAFAS
ncbi:hypothetical protein EWM64_g8837 [Hericium alpestre]|uniref:Uncharacterized protein n=1 Tax=Hericium alpestre TaxID=135208 RepID=A0A4Y9ZKB0_9AGAM|nr:hypothetical protein EWM64_g8837 [Hericium alpestre]